MNNWKQVATLEDIPPLGSRVIKSAQGDIALFRTAENEVFALLDKCPHKGGHLSQGIVFGKKVACPMHNWHIQLEDGNSFDIIAQQRRNDRGNDQEDHDKII